MIMKNKKNERIYKVINYSILWSLQNDNLSLYFFYSYKFRPQSLIQSHFQTGNFNNSISNNTLLFISQVIY